MNRAIYGIIIGGSALGASVSIQSLCSSKTTVVVNDFTNQATQKGFLENTASTPFKSYASYVLNGFSEPSLPFIANGPMFYPKWKKLKYWQATKKHPKRRFGK